MHSFLRRVSANARDIASAVMALVSAVVVVLVAATCITVPLWLLATRAPDIYAVLLAVLLGGALVSVLVARVKHRAEAEDPRGTPDRRSVFRVLGRIAAAIVLLAIVYLAISFLVSGHPVPGIVAAAGLLLFLLVLRNPERRDA